MRGLIGKKIGMTRVFDSNGFAVPVTVLEAGPCQVTQVKSIEKDGYDSVQVGFNEVSLKHLNKPMKGHFDKQSVTPMRVLAEFNKVPNFDYKPGQVFNVGLFKEGDYVTVSGKSKGRGFSGTIKRYSFSQQRKTHGQGDTHRHVGSIGAASDPSRVFPGKKMPGRHGNKKVSVKSLEVIKVDEGNNQLLLKGGIPGARNGIVIITR
ncbi:MAG: 50S ribosomal protein L3 [Candidatus Marinimicrobia bacterium]|jgi:large subunit ribosomal protein L3|uniref:50S ribosomal protein L3 n=1 Tax=marine metagenome TaxID=408172 RepID=A0A382P8F3_9ZZZZ|nr:50S ribosomal protein L3 [Candidatus Neomarinimicrobiota bacterium]MEE3152841.1 50S ribosomal protein L3 [Candidatus Neomarinimicrobiota bacterium]|tara:strand:- start:220 stop:837 length:618 start_codon:yes stop_codon:yes gene_type:complete